MLASLVILADDDVREKEDQQARDLRPGRVMRDLRTIIVDTPQQRAIVPPVRPLSQELPLTRLSRASP